MGRREEGGREQTVAGTGSAAAGMSGAKGGRAAAIGRAGGAAAHREPLCGVAKVAAGGDGGLAPLEPVARPRGAQEDRRQKVLERQQPHGLPLRHIGAAPPRGADAAAQMLSEVGGAGDLGQGHEAGLA